MNINMRDPFELDESREISETSSENSEKLEAEEDIVFDLKEYEKLRDRENKELREGSEGGDDVQEAEEDIVFDLKEYEKLRDFENQELTEGPEGGDDVQEAEEDIVFDLKEYEKLRDFKKQELTEGSDTGEDIKEVVEDIKQIEEDIETVEEDIKEVEEDIKEVEEDIKEEIKEETEKRDPQHEELTTETELVEEVKEEDIDLEVKEEAEKRDPEHEELLEESERVEEVKEEDIDLEVKEETELRDPEHEELSEESELVEEVKEEKIDIDIKDEAELRDSEHDGLTDETEIEEVKEEKIELDLKEEAELRDPEHEELTDGTELEEVKEEKIDIDIKEEAELRDSEHDELTAETELEEVKEESIDLDFKEETEIRDLDSGGLTEEIEQEEEIKEVELEDHDKIEFKDHDEIEFKEHEETEFKEEHGNLEQSNSSDISESNDSEEKSNVDELSDIKETLKKEKEDIETVIKVASVWNHRFNQWVENGDGGTLKEMFQNSWKAQIEAAKEGGLWGWLNYNKEEFKKETINLFEDSKSLANKLLIDRNKLLRAARDVLEERKQQRIENGEGSTYKEMFQNSWKAQLEAAKQGPKPWWNYNKTEFKEEAKHLFEDSKKLASKYIDRNKILGAARDVLEERKQQRIENGEGSTYKEMFQTSWKAQLEAAKQGPKAWWNHNKAEFKEEAKSLFEDSKKFASKYIDRNKLLSAGREVMKERQEQRIENGEGSTFKEMLQNSWKAKLEAAKQGPKAWWNHNKAEFKEEAKNLFEDSKKLASKYIDRNKSLRTGGDVLKERHDQFIKDGDGGTKEIVINGWKAHIEAAKQGPKAWWNYNKVGFGREINALFADSKKFLDRLETTKEIKHK
jgi:hypothetical protein